ncbi:unnamed protein product [Ectocarpus sp. 12 AP-2014]
MYNVRITRWRAPTCENRETGWCVRAERERGRLEKNATRRGRGAEERGERLRERRARSHTHIHEESGMVKKRPKDAEDPGETEVLLCERGETEMERSESPRDIFINTREIFNVIGVMPYFAAFFRLRYAYAKDRVCAWACLHSGISTMVRAAEMAPGCVHATPVCVSLGIAPVGEIAPGCLD